MYTKAEQDRIYKRQKNSRWLLEKVRSKFMEPGFNAESVDRCFYTRQFDLLELGRGPYPICIRHQNHDVTVVAFKRNGEVADPSPIEDALIYTIEKPPY